MENLDRGVIVLPGENGGVYVNWRLLGTESNSTRFHVYRTANNETRQLTIEPLDGATIFIDLPDRHYENSYFVRPLEGSKELPRRSPRTNNFAIWWDGDELRELIDANRIDKSNWREEKPETVFVASEAMPAAATKSSPVLQADLFGDWREEFILRV